MSYRHEPFSSSLTEIFSNISFVCELLRKTQTVLFNTTMADYRLRFTLQPSVTSARVSSEFDPAEVSPGHPLVVLCPDLASRVAVHEQARLAGLKSVGFRSNHAEALDIMYGKCYRCQTWSPASLWDGGPPCDVLFAPAQGNPEWWEYIQSVERERCENSFTMCPTCKKYCDKFEWPEADNCPCTRNRITCREHAVFKLGHNAVFVCVASEPFPVKLGRKRRARRRRHVASK